MIVSAKSERAAPRWSWSSLAQCAVSAVAALRADYPLGFPSDAKRLRIFCAIAEAKKGAILVVDGTDAVCTLVGSTPC